MTTHGCDVCSHLCDVPGCGSKESSCATAVAIALPMGDDIERVPVEFTEDGLSGGRGDYSKDSASSENERQEWQLDVLALGALRIPAKVWDIASKRCPGSGNS